MDLVLGVDGGNSKTFALVADLSGRILGFGRGPGSNHENLGFAETGVVLERCAQEALGEARGKAPASMAYWGLAGADIRTDEEDLTKLVAGLGLAARNVVRNDTIVSMAAGMTRGWGVGVICGAGFNAAGISPDGREVRFPAMGAPTGDWGGGSDIGMETLRLAYRSLDGRGRTSVLEQRVADALGLSTLEEVPMGYRNGLITWETCRDRLPPVLFAAANDGDKVAQDLVVRIGKEVGVSARTIIKRLGMENLDVEVVLGGSIFRGEGPLLLDTVIQDIQQSVPKARIVLPEFPPIVGALFQAIRCAGAEVDELVRETVRKTLPAALR